MTARGEDEQQAETLREALVQKFRDRLGDLIYSEEAEGLERVVVSGADPPAPPPRDGGELHRRSAGAADHQRGRCVEVFDFGAVTYAAAAKRRILGVKPAAIKKYSVYSATVAAQMAFGVQKQGKSDFGVGITGIAGPTGGTEEKPVGTVYVAVSCGHEVWVKRLSVEHSERSRVRRMSTQHALDMVRPDRARAAGAGCAPFRAACGGRVLITWRNRFPLRRETVFLFWGIGGRSRRYGQKWEFIL